jgi:hypothetical protein
MKLSKTLKLTLAAIAAVGLISTARADQFVISTDMATQNVPIPPLVFTGSIQGSNGTGGVTSFNPVNLTAIIDTTPGHAMLDLLGSIHANGAGTITVCLAADGFTGTSPLSFGFVANSAGNANSISLSDTLLINGMSQQASTNTVILAPAPHGVSQGMSNTVTVTPNSSPFTLENCITITFGRGGGTVSFDKILGQGAVPDSGMSVSLLGIGLLAIAGVAKLRRMVTA